MIRLYAIGGLVAILAGVSGYVWYLHNTIDNLKAREVELVFAIDSCSSRVENLIEDMKSDTKVDSTPDSGLRDLIDPSWLLGD